MNPHLERTLGVDALNERDKIAHQLKPQQFHGRSRNFCEQHGSFLVHADRLQTGSPADAVISWDGSKFAAPATVQRCRAQGPAVPGTRGLVRVSVSVEIRHLSSSFLGLLLRRELKFGPLFLWRSGCPMREQNGELDLRLIRRVGGRMLVLQPALQSAPCHSVNVVRMVPIATEDPVTMKIGHLACCDRAMLIFG